MNVAELKKILNDYPDDMLVVTRGFDESGYEPLQTIEIIHISPILEHKRGLHSSIYDDIGYLNTDKSIVIKALHINF